MGGSPNPDPGSRSKWRKVGNRIRIRIILDADLKGGEREGGGREKERGEEGERERAEGRGRGRVGGKRGKTREEGVKRRDK